MVPNNLLIVLPNYTWFNEINFLTSLIKSFDKYLYGTNNDKDNIISKINAVLLGNIKLEDLLKDTEISINSCQDRI